MSWKSDNSIALDAAFEFVYNIKGSMLIAAGGNVSSFNFVEYPAKNKYVIAVAGIEKNWTHLGNYGNELEISAPAEDIYSTRYDQINDISYYGIFQSGTSFASPMVSGAAALLWSNYPTLTNFDIRRILRETAYSDFANYDELYFGDGLLKIDSALLYVQNMPNKPTGVSIYAPIGGKPTISWNPVPGADYYKFYRSEPNLKMALSSIITTTDTFYTDNQVTVVHPKFALLTYYYRVTSVDNGYESPVSSEVSVSSNSIWKIGGDGNTKTLKTVELFHNYPNPFNPATVIKYRINEDSFVQLKVYDILGRLVKTLVSIMQAAGEYSIEFNAEDLSAGVYFYTLSANDFYQTRKMILLP
ncbi:MAG: S8 family serine peptidase [Bacteroidetes bacterium]|nr:S8 family serine peptidase [Bacteroidota bacterium]